MQLNCFKNGNNLLHNAFNVQFGTPDSYWSMIGKLHINVIILSSGWLLQGVNG